ncbi:hypothetical protein CGK32_22755 [Vibrio parahaemolyticus]|uniref:hypothetical protein n=1 Tax=Vibrio parahaemolyticus TaxID=670 RepID=UPI00111EEDC8|nr:hypothetical protein [Vibrio parahaemolyticus]TOA18437.1 hypothetical protein CGK32_22755 [Vibrio parahaemolyticus]
MPKIIEPTNNKALVARLVELAFQNDNQQTALGAVKELRNVDEELMKEVLDEHFEVSSKATVNHVPVPIPNVSERLKEVKERMSAKTA